MGCRIGVVDFLGVKVKLLVDKRVIVGKEGDAGK